MVVNNLAEVTHRQTTSLFAASARRLGQTVILASVGSVVAKSNFAANQFIVRGKALPAESTSAEAVATVANDDASELVHVALTEKDVVLIRTNPGRDMARFALHEAFLDLMMLAEESGICVVNSPGNLLRFADKSSLLRVDPAHRPEMVVAAQVCDIIDFVRSAPVDCVVKPLRGSRGRNVIRLSPQQGDLEAVLSDHCREDFLVAQHFVEANHPGDRRVVVFDGKVLESDGHIAGIERHPAAGEFRGNLHMGGSAHRLSLTGQQREAAENAARMLLQHGIRLAGIDMVGDQIIEFNVFSTGGLYDANRFAGVDFTETIIRTFLRGKES